MTYTINILYYCRMRHYFLEYVAKSDTTLFFKKFDNFGMLYII